MTENFGLPLHKQNGVKKLILQHHLSPGDCLVMSAAIESLHLQFPGYLTDVDVSVPAIYENNPRISKLTRSEAWLIRMEYPLINSSHVQPAHFMEAFCRFLGERLEVPLRLSVSHPYLYLSDAEKAWKPQVEELAGKPVKYWCVNAGTKPDFTCKGWGWSQYQEVVDRLKGRIQFVQIGEKGHLHKKLNGVIDLIGQTDTRQFIRLCYHAQGGLGPSTFLQHVMAAYGKPYCCLVGGREPKAWLDYANQVTLSTQGQLTCCSPNACWRSRVIKINDGSSQDASLCEKPYWDGGEWVPQCLAMIHPCDVVSAIERYYTGGVLQMA